MALLLTVPSIPSSLSHTPKRFTAHGFIPQKCLSNNISCSTTTTPIYTTTNIPRRSGKWKPSIWEYDYIQSLTTDYKLEAHATRVEKLKEDVKHLRKETHGSLAQMELIDSLQRPGLRHLFDNEIKEMIYTISLDNTNMGEPRDHRA